MSELAFYIDQRDLMVKTLEIEKKGLNHWYELGKPKLIQFAHENIESLENLIKYYDIVIENEKERCITNE